MLRRWLCIASVLAVGAAMVAADAAQARERGMRGRRGRNAVNGTNYSDSSPRYSDSSSGYTVMGTYTDSGERRSFYYAPDSLPPSKGDAPVLIDVRTPPDAKILFDGKGTTQTGLLRAFVSPPLKPGQSFTYEIKAKWSENGQDISRTRKVPVRAGEWLMVDLTRMAQGDVEQR